MKIKLLRGSLGMASCLRVARLLQSHLDGELDARRVGRVTAHLQICRRCGLDAASYQEIKSALSRHRTPVAEVTLHRLEAFVQQLGDPSDAGPPAW